MTPAEPRPDNRFYREPRVVTAVEPTRERVEAMEKALGCERLGHVTYETCLVHGVAVAASLSDPRSVADALSDGVGLWTDLGCPVAVAAARVEAEYEGTVMALWLGVQHDLGRAEAERDALRAVVEQVRAFSDQWNADFDKGFDDPRPYELRDLLPEPVE